MFRRCCWMAAAAVVISSLPCEALARDVLAAIVAQPKLNSRDKAKITSEVTQRARELVDAKSDDARRKEARDTLVGTSRVKNASPVGIAAYAAACSEQLGGLVTKAELEPALDAILVLVAIDHVNTTNALAAATLSAPSPPSAIGRSEAFNCSNPISLTTSRPVAPPCGPWAERVPPNATHSSSASSMTPSTSARASPISASRRPSPRL